MALHSTSARGDDAAHFRIAVLVVFVLVALVLQACLPLYFDSLSILDLPLIAVIYLALALRSPVAGLLSGAAIGIAQDTLSRDLLGVFGIADTVVGYLTAALSSKMDTENPGIRVILIFALYWAQLGCVYLLDWMFLEETIQFAAGRNAVAALVNAFLGMLLFELLDRFKSPG